MPLYFFDLVDGEGFIPDPEGRWFAREDDAKAEPLKEMREVMGEALREGTPIFLDRYYVAVRREDGSEALRFYFREAAPIIGE
jgi:hypothetical protein